MTTKWYSTEEFSLLLRRREESNTLWLINSTLDIMLSTLYIILYCTHIVLAFEAIFENEMDLSGENSVQRFQRHIQVF